MQKINDNIFVYCPEETDERIYEAIYEGRFTFLCEDKNEKKALDYLADVLNENAIRLEKEIDDIERFVKENDIMQIKLPADLTVNTYMEYSGFERAYFASFVDTFEGVSISSSSKKNRQEAVDDVVGQLRKCVENMRKCVSDIDKVVNT